MAESNTDELRFVYCKFTREILAVPSVSCESDEEFSLMSAARTLNLILMLSVIQKLCRGKGKLIMIARSY